MARWIDWLLRRPVPFDLVRAAQSVVESGNASGRPKGLSWKSATPIGPVEVVGAFTVVPFEIQFEIIPDSAMEGIDAATIPRPVVAVFRYVRRWVLARPPVFNVGLDAVKQTLTKN
jgi:hypothetical protein